MLPMPPAADVRSPRPSAGWPWVLGLLVALTAWAGGAAAQQYQITTYEAADGLPSSDIKSIAQDARGRMWFATRAGLVAYDGLAWTSVALDVPATAQSRGRLLVDATGGLWCLFPGTKASLWRLDGDAWEARALPALSDAESAFTATATFVADGRASVLVVATDRGELWVQRDGAWRRAAAPPPGTRITALAGGGGRIFVGTDSGLLAIPAATPESMTPVPLPADRTGIKALAWEAGAERLWIVGADWIGRFGRNGFTLLATQLDLRLIPEFPQVMATPDRRGGLYVASPVALFHHRPEHPLAPIGAANGCIFDGATALCVDREGILWQGTMRGLSKIVSRRFAGYTREQGLFGGEVTALLERRDGRVVVAHVHGLTFWGDPPRTRAVAPPDPRTRILDLAEDADGGLWLAGRSRGLGHLAPDGSLTWQSWRVGETDNVVAVRFDQAGRMWFSNSDTMLVVDGDGVRGVPMRSPVSDPVHYRVLELLRDGTMAVGTSIAGLALVRPDGEVLWAAPGEDELMARDVYAIHEDPDGTLWVGTRVGLFEVRGDRLVRPVRPGLHIDLPVYFVQRDREGRLWCGAQNGVFRYGAGRLDHFTAETGLIGRETNRHAALVGRDGRVWIGTERGLTIYDHTLDLYEPRAPLVTLGRLEAHGAILPLSGDVTVPAGARTLRLGFRAIALATELPLRFRSRLVGFDDEWLDPYESPTQEIRYTNLKPGTYRFELQAAGFGLPWSETVSSGEIVVPGVWWGQPWFVAVVATTGVILLFAGWGLYDQRRYNRRLRAEVDRAVAENLRFESELQQAQRLRSLGVLAGGIAHDFNNLLTVVLGNLSLLEVTPDLGRKARDRVAAGIRGLHRARHLANQLLTFSQGGAPVLQVGSLADVIGEAAEFTMRGADARCRNDLPADLWPVAMDADQMSQVVDNLLLNARQAARSGGEIVIAGRNLATAPADLPAGRWVEVTVSDDGPGIPPDHLGQIFDPYFTTREGGTGLGLSTAYAIVERHGGHLDVRSRPGKGATFRFRLPAAEPVAVAAPARSADPVDAELGFSGRALVMDDEDDVRDAIGQMLIELGLTVDEATDGAQAIAMYRTAMAEAGPYDVVLMDLTVPGGLGGKDAVGPLLKLDPDARVVVVSGYADDPVLAEHRHYGFRTAIAKPLALNDLRQVLATILPARAPGGPADV